MAGKLQISLAVVMFLTVQLLAVGCSRQDSDDNAKPQKVVVKIHRPSKNTEYVNRSNKKDGSGAMLNSQPSEAEHPPKARELRAQPSGETPQPVQELIQENHSGSEQGWYHVGEKDTLIVVAGSSRIYSDPYKWISLLRLNLNALEPFGLSGGIESRELPQGLGLKYLTPTEVKQRRQQIQGCRWVVNILSDKGTQKISELAVKMAKNGIPVYVAKAEIKGEQWLRLRCGFFPNLDEAKHMREKIEELTGLKGLWIAKVSDKEFERYAGY